VFVKEAEINLRRRVSLVSGKFVQARGLAIILGQAAMAVFVKEAEINLRRRVSLVSGKFVEARRPRRAERS
jgi:hypothetical protein